MIKGLKICGVSDPETLNYILNHNHKPTMIGFITNYEKSKRFVKLEKLKNLINIDKKQIKFVSVLVNPDDEILEKIKDKDMINFFDCFDIREGRLGVIVTFLAILEMVKENFIDISQNEKFSIIYLSRKSDNEQ